MNNLDNKAKEVLLTIKEPLKFLHCDGCGVKYVVLRLHRTLYEYGWTDKISVEVCPYCGRVAKKGP